MGSEAIDRFLSHSNYYEALGLRRDFTNDELRAAYRRRAPLLHPDRNPDPRAGEAFALLNNMRDTLSGQTTRYDYDRVAFPVPPPVSVPPSNSNFAPDNPKTEEPSTLLAFVVVVLFAVFVLYLTGISSPAGFNKADLEKVISFGNFSAHTHYKRFSSDPHHRQFTVPKEWLDKLDSKGRNTKIEEALRRFADEIYIDRLRANCKTERATQRSAPSCLELKRMQ
jgi:curved DNA-binding protein CbpA